MAHQQINSLQIGRAIAAISVVVLHSTMATEYFVQKAPSNFLLFSSHGYLGVDFFFVLSGFIIYHIHRDDDRSFTAFLNYLKKRISRIYAPYLPISVFLIVTYLLFPALSASQRQWGIISSLTLFPTESPPALSVAWTLQHEIMFYLLFSLTYFYHRANLLFLAWVICLLTVWQTGFSFHIPIMDLLFSPINLEFAAGVITAHFYPRAQRALVLPLAFGSLLAIFLAFTLRLVDTDRLFFGLALAPFVLAIAVFEREREREREREILRKIRQGYF